MYDTKGDKVEGTEIESDSDSEREEETDSEISLVWTECIQFHLSPSSWISFPLIPPESWQVETKKRQTVTGKQQGSGCETMQWLYGDLHLLSPFSMSYCNMLEF